VALPSIASATTHVAAASSPLPTTDSPAISARQSVRPAARPHPLSIAASAANAANARAAALPPSPVVVAVAHTTQPPASPAEYRVRSGDTLSGIAASLLGDGDRYAEIFDLNRDRAEPGGTHFTDPNMIQPGWTLALPAAGPTSHSTSYSASSRPVTQKSTSSTKAKSSQTQQAHPAATAGGSLNGWITEAITVLNAHGYSVSYQAIYETAMHESSGNPDSVDRSDSNAAEGHPSIGLMQTIQPTFDEYALSGYDDIYNPVDNIIAAVRYAAANYGSLDDVVAERCGGSCWRGY